MRLIIPFSLPGLNEYIEAERGHRQKGAKLKRDCQTSVILALRRQIRTPLREPVFMRYLWVEKPEAGQGQHLQLWPEGYPGRLSEDGRSEE